MDTLDTNLYRSVTLGLSLNWDEPVNFLDRESPVSVISDSSLNQEETEEKSSSETTPTRAYHQPSEKPVNVSDNRPTSENIAVRSQHGSHTSSGSRANPNAQANSANDQVDLIEVTQHIHIRTNRDHVQGAAVALNQLQPQDSNQGYSDVQGIDMSPGSALTFKNLYALHGRPLRPSFPTRNQEPDYGESSYMFCASPYEIYYIAGNTNMSLCPEYSKYKICVILACIPDDPAALARAGDSCRWI